MKYLHNKITEIRRVAPEYALLRFAGEDAVSGAPGQFAMVRGNWGTDPVLPRAFSLVESGDVGAVLVRDVGRGTSLLCHLRPGDDLGVLAPLGNAYALPAAGEKAILVAGGVGVAPLVFLANELKRAGIPTLFLYGARTANDLPLAEEIGELCELRITTEDGAAGQTGLVTAPLAEILREGGNAVVYSCGPHPMLKAVGDLAMRHGAACQVALESPMACGMGTCKGCAIVDSDGNFKYVCTDGPVFEARKIFGGQQ